MPLAAMMTRPEWCRLRARDCSGVRMNSSRPASALSPRLPERHGVGVVQGDVLGVELGGGDGHGAVDADAPVGEAPLVVMPREQVQQFLGAADGEGRDEHVAAAFARRGEDVLHLGEGPFAGAVQAVAVGGLEQHGVGLLDPHGIAQDGRVGLAEVAGEHELAGLARSSLSHSSTMAEPRIWPASRKRTRMPGQTSAISS
jgi:hypothetical protein